MSEEHADVNYVALRILSNDERFRGRQQVRCSDASLFLQLVDEGLGQVHRSIILDGRLVDAAGRNQLPTARILFDVTSSLPNHRAVVAEQQPGDGQRPYQQLGIEVWLASLGEEPSIVRQPTGGEIAIDLRNAEYLSTKEPTASLNFFLAPNLFDAVHRFGRRVRRLGAQPRLKLGLDRFNPQHDQAVAVVRASRQ